MKPDSAYRALLIHAAVYVAVIALCAALALSREPPKHWFVWVAAGWGIGLGAHALAVWLTHSHARLARDPSARGFAIHAFVYLAVVALLFGVNIAAGKHHYWAAFVAMGWGIGVAVHGLAVLRHWHAPRSDGPGPREEA